MSTPAAGAAAGAKPDVKVKREQLAVQHPERLNYDSLEWTVVRGAPAARIPADRVQEFVENEGSRCCTQFFLQKTRKPDGKVHSPRRNSPRQYRIPTRAATISGAWH